jgi:2-haloacid dehalogenase
MSVSTQMPPPGEPKPPDSFEPRMLSFDVFGALVNTPPANLCAFQAILAEMGWPDLDPRTVYAFWEKQNIAHYREPDRRYKDICRLSLSGAYERFGVAAGREEAIQRFFDCFASMALYPDVLPALDVLARGQKLALVSNIDDDLLGMTTLGREFDLACTAERARGYKPDGLTIAWINRRGLHLDPSVPPPDLILSGLQPLCGLLGNSNPTV